MSSGLASSRPPPLLAFDCVGDAQLFHNDSTGPITPHRAVTQVFHCRSDHLHRLEVFLETGGRINRCHLWLRLVEGTDGSRPALRRVGPLACERLQSHGWFAFEFAPIASSAGKTYVAVIESPDGFVGTAVGLRMRRGVGDGLAIGGTPAPGALLYRAGCLRHQAQAANFDLFREAWRTRGPVTRHLPLMARLEISRVCDLECVMCPLSVASYRASLKGPGFMSLATLRQLDPILPTLVRVLAFGLGEPLLNPDFMAILRHIRRLNPTAHISASTNATRLDAATARAVVEEELITDLQISIDGARRQTFEAVRVHADHAATLRALDHLLAARARSSGPDRLIVKTEMVVMKPTAGEVLEYVRQMAARGVDHIVLDSPKGPLVGNLVITDPDEMLRVYEQVQEAHVLLRGQGTVLSGPLMEELRCWHVQSGRPGSVPDWGEDPCAELSGIMPVDTSPCSVPWESCSLAASGATRVCCNNYNSMGSVASDTFESIWRQSPSYQQLRTELAGKKPGEACRACLAQNTVAPDQITPATYLQSSLRERVEFRDAPAVVLSSRTSAAPPESDLRFDLDSTPAPSAASSRLSGWITGSALPREEVSLAVFEDSAFTGFATVLPVGDGLGKWCVTRPPATAGRDIALYLHRGQAWEPVRPGLASARRSNLLARCADLAARDAAAPAPSLSGFVEEAAAVGEFLIFSGWAGDASGNKPACGIILSIGGRPRYSTHPWIHRADVGRHFAASDPHFGFSLEIPRRALAGVPPGSIEILAVNDEGQCAALPWLKPSARTALLAGTP